MRVKMLSGDQKDLRRRILEISFKHNLSHLGSCLSAVDLINGVYMVKERSEEFVLSNGHAGVAWYAVLEKKGRLNIAEIEKLHIHPDRNEKHGIAVSTGSLGHGLPIAVGMAIANRKKRVYCMISDGEIAEGSVWESLRIALELRLNNLVVIVNFNGWGAYAAISKTRTLKQLRGFGWMITPVDGHKITAIEKALRKKTVKPHLLFAQTTVEQFSFLKDQDAHYYVMKEEDYKKALEALK